jgi:hypothetical protein
MGISDMRLRVALTDWPHSTVARPRSAVRTNTGDRLTGARDHPDSDRKPAPPLARASTLSIADQWATRVGSILSHLQLTTQSFPAYAGSAAPQNSRGCRSPVTTSR